MGKAEALGLLALIAGTTALVYNATQCTGFIDFELRDGAPIDSIEEDVKDVMGLSLIPFWLRQACTNQIRRYNCLSKYLTYAQSAPTNICHSVCYDLVDYECAFLLSEVDSYGYKEAYHQYLNVPTSCDTFPTSNCSAGGEEYSFFVDDEAVCPLPLAKTDPHLTFADSQRLVSSTLFLVSDCNVHCPQILYDAKKWANMRQAMTICAWTSLVCAIITLTLVVKQKKAQILQFLFLVGCAGSSVAMILLGDNDDAYCDGVYVNPYGPRCVSQGYMSIFFFLFISVTIACQAVDVFVKVVRGYKGKKLRRLKQIYVFCIFVVPTTVVLYESIVGAVISTNENEQIGFNSLFPLPFCFYKTVTAFNRTFLFPILCLLSLCVSLVLVTCSNTVMLISKAAKIQQSHSTSGILVSDDLSEGKTSSLRRKSQNVLKHLFRHNLHASLFVITYCFATVAWAIIVLIEHSKEESYWNNFIAWNACILYESFVYGTVDAGINNCGSVPRDTRPPMGLAEYEGIFFAAPGIFALLIYSSVLYTFLRGTLAGRGRQRKSVFSSLVAEIQNQQVLPQWSTPAQNCTDIISSNGTKTASLHSVHGIQHTMHSVQSDDVNQKDSTRGLEYASGEAVVVATREIAVVQSLLGRGQFGSVYHVVTRTEPISGLAMKCARFLDRKNNNNILEFCQEAVTSLRIGAHLHIVALRYGIYAHA